MSEKKFIFLQHQYPNFILKFPLLIHGIYAINFIIHVRIWYALRFLYKELKALKSSDTYTDIGFGEGQYSLGIKHFYPKLHFTLIDKLHSNVEFANLYINKYNLKYTKAFLENVENYALPKAQLSLCVGVFQYIKEHEKAMQNIFNNTAVGGKLLIYFSINGRFVFKQYERMLALYPNYESINNRQRVYTYEEATNLLTQVGFKIEKQRFTYGFFGILSNELYNMQIINLNRVPILFKPFLYLVLGVSVIPILLFNVLDFLIVKKNGNGLIVVAKKNSSY